MAQNNVMTIYCGQCGAEMRVSAAHAGKAVRCGQCRVKLPVPSSYAARPQIRLFCPQCGAKVRAWTNQAGQAMTCPKCKEEITLPPLGGESKAEAAARKEVAKAKSCPHWKSGKCVAPGFDIGNDCNWLESDYNGCAVYKASAIRVAGGSREDELRAMGVIGDDDDVHRSAGRLTIEKRSPKMPSETAKDDSAVRAPQGVAFTVYFEGNWFIGDCMLEIALDDSVLGHGSLINGFAIRGTTTQGQHELSVKWGRRTCLQEMLTFSSPGNYFLHLSLNRWLKTFTVVQREAEEQDLVLAQEKGQIAATSRATSKGTHVMECPQCGARLPFVRIPTSLRQALRGGWTCKNCGCELDRKGNEILPRKPSAVRTASKKTHKVSSGTNVLSQLQALQGKVSQLSIRHASKASIGGPGAAKAKQQLPTFCEVLGDAIRALQTGLDIHNNPISQSQVAAGLGRLVTETSRPEWQGIVGATLEPSGFPILKECLAELAQITEGLARQPSEAACPQERTEKGIACPQCNQCLKPKGELAGEKVKCPKCGFVFTIQLGRKATSSPKPSSATAARPRVPASSRIQTLQDIQAVYKEAVALSKAEKFDEALALYDLLLNNAGLGFFNPYDMKTERAIVLCKGGHYPEAEAACQELMAVLKTGGVPLGQTKAMYWYLVARYKGDSKRAMDEYAKM